MGTCSLFIWSLLFHWKLLILKSDCEGFAYVALYKRAIVSNSLMWLFTKEGMRANTLLKKSNVSDALVIQANCLQKMSDLQKNCFFHRFLTFSPLFMNCFRCSSLIRSFHKWLEQFAPVTLYKSVSLSNSLRLLMPKERESNL